jgi:diguanylate cyclase (GGDEF)-like protein
MKQHSRATARQPDGAAAALETVRSSTGLGDDRPSLLHALRRAHVRLGLMAVIAAAATLTLLSVLTLRTHVDRNLSLIARSIAYAAEAAVMFDDADAARDTLRSIADGEGLLAATILRRDGSRLAHYHHDPDRVVEETVAEFGSLMFHRQATMPVLHQGDEIGRVQVRGNGGVYLLFLLEVLAAIAACAAVTAWRVSRLSGEIEREVVRPLNLLASLTRRARLARSASLRAPPAGVREVHELGEDINALLAEVASHEAELVAEHDTLKSANESLSFLAFHDSLTGLPNRARFMECAARALGLHGPREERLAVLYIDIDHFKAINDRMGHAAGDELLVEVATRIRTLLREGGFVARLGGDELAVLLAPIHTRADAAVVADRIAQAIRVPLLSALFGRIDPSASIGVAVFPDDGQELERLLAAADAAMYRAKGRRAGSSEIRFSSDPGDTRPAPLDA